MEIQWPLVLFTLFSSMGGCLFVFVGINEFTKKSKTDGFMPGLVSIILAVVGGLCSVAHLAHVERMMNALSHPTSGIFVEAVLIGCLVVCVAVYLLCLKRNVAGGVKVFAVLGIVFGIALSFMAGHSYIMAAIATWDTILLPTGYLLTALPMGAALYWALACKDDVSRKFMATCTVVCGILGFIGTLAYAAVSGAFFGGVTAVVSVLAIILSGIIPTAIGYLTIKKSDKGAPASTEDAAKKAEEPAETAKDEAATEAAASAADVKEASEEASKEKKDAEAAEDAKGSDESKIANPFKDEASTNVWIAFASAAVGALLYRVLMWLMYVSAYGFFGNRFL